MIHSITIAVKGISPENVALVLNPLPFHFALLLNCIAKNSARDDQALFITSRKFPRVKRRITDGLCSTSAYRNGPRPL